MNNSFIREKCSRYNTSSVLDLALYRDLRKREQSKMQDCSHECPGCIECVNMLQIEHSGFICDALEIEETGESFYVIKDGEKTIDYYSCSGEFFVQRLRHHTLKPILKRL